MLGANLRGEMSGGPPKPQRKNRAADEWDLVDAVARTLLHVNGSEELTALGGVLFPAMLGNAVARSDLNKLDELKGFVSTHAEILFRFCFIFSINFPLALTTKFAETFAIMIARNCLITKINSSFTDHSIRLTSIYLHFF